MKYQNMRNKILYILIFILLRHTPARFLRLKAECPAADDCMTGLVLNEYISLWLGWCSGAAGWQAGIGTNIIHR